MVTSMAMTPMLIFPLALVPGMEIIIVHPIRMGCGDIPIHPGVGIMDGVGVPLIITEDMVRHGTIHGIAHAAIATDIMTITPPIIRPTPTMAQGNRCTALMAAEGRLMQEARQPLFPMPIIAVPRVM